MSSNKRITKELASLTNDPHPNFAVTLPPSASIHTWHVIASPPPSTPYHPGRFALVLTLPTDYPFKPPRINFATRIYHPNVTDDAAGNVCLAVLKPENWKPNVMIRQVLDAIADLLATPNPDDFLEERIAIEYKDDRETWEKKAKESVKKYALGEPTFPPAA